MVRNCLILLVVMALHGCATQRAEGMVKEQRLIQPDQKITIIWDIAGGGICDNPSIDCNSVYGLVYSNSYESCTNAHLEHIFFLNGYSAKAVKVRDATIRSISIDTPYVLLLHNTTAKVVGLTSKANPSINRGMLSSLQVDGALFDSQSGHILWQVSNYWAPQAESNGTPVLLLVRALAADGFLNLKAEDVVDYRRNKGTSEASEGCPNQ